MVSAVVSEVDRLKATATAARAFLAAHEARAPDYPIWTLREREAAHILYAELRHLLGEDADARTPSEHPQDVAAGV